MTPRFKTDATGALVPGHSRRRRHHLRSETGQVLWEENAQDKRSIASITKVMTAVVFLEDQPDLSQDVTIERGDTYAASTTYLRANERVTLDNLLHLTLIASDNAAARALARLSHGGTATFVERMNERRSSSGSRARRSPIRRDSIREHLVRLRSLAAHHLCRDRRADRADHADSRVHGHDQPPDDQHPQHQPPGDRRRRRRDGREDRLHLEGRALPRDAAAHAAGQSRSRSSCSARTSNPGRFWETRHLFNWLSQKAAGSLPQRPAAE